MSMLVRKEASSNESDRSSGQKIGQGAAYFREKLKTPDAGKEKVKRKKQRLPV